MKIRILSTILILLFVPACNSTFEVGLEHSPAAGSPIPAATSVPPTATLLAPTETPVPTEAAGASSIHIYLIALEDNGQSGDQVGCGDSLIPVEVEIQPTQGVLKAALEALLSVKSQYYGESGLYNALYQSDLQVESVSIDSGKASVYLTGSLKMGGECDTPRIRAQLEKTVLQFPTVTDAAIFVNGVPLPDVLSLKG